MHQSDLDRLNEKEIYFLFGRLYSYEIARSNKNYALSDELRSDLTDRGVDVNFRQWRPTLETSEHRLSRWEARNAG